MQNNELNTYNELHIGDLVGDTKRMVIAYTKLAERIPGDSYARWVAICVKENQYHSYAVWDIFATPNGFCATSGVYAFTLEEALNFYYERGGKRNA